MISCVLKRLPEDLEMTCASAQKAQAAAYPGHPAFIALLNDKKWPGGKVDLGVRFLDTQNTELKTKILAYANKWGDGANVRFRESASGEVRLARQDSGYWSYLGTDVLSIPAGQATMNLQGFTTTTLDFEYDRVVPHEFGHTLGMPHEHERTDILALLDVEKTVQFFWRTYGWSRATTMQQVFDPLDPGSIFASAPDVRSIMCYQFAAECTKSGYPIPGGGSINALDREFCGKFYPAVVLPPPPPPPPPPPGVSGMNGTLTVIDGRLMGFVATPRVTGSEFTVDLKDYFRFPALHPRAVAKIRQFLESVESESLPGSVTYEGSLIRFKAEDDGIDVDKLQKILDMLIKFIEALMKMFGS